MSTDAQWKINTLLPGFVLILTEKDYAYCGATAGSACVCVSLLKCSNSIASTQRDKSWQTKGIVGFRDYFQLSYSGWRGATPQKHFN